jgi:hypothetical protein
MSGFDRQGQIELNIGNTSINTIVVDSAKFGNEVHFMTFAANFSNLNFFKSDSITAKFFARNCACEIRPIVIAHATTCVIL